jgi:hypothetical protein
MAGGEQSMKLKEAKIRVAKGDLSPGHEIEVWNALVKKSERIAREVMGGGGLRWKQELALARELERDVASGGGLFEYLSAGNAAVNQRVAVQKHEKAKPHARLTKSEVEIERIAGSMRDSDPRLSRDVSIAKAWDSRADLYTSYTEEQRRGEDAEYNIDESGVSKRDIQSRMRTKAHELDSDDGDDDRDDDADDEDDDGRDNASDTTADDVLRDKRRKKRKGVYVGKLNDNLRCSKCSKLSDDTSATKCASCGAKLGHDYEDAVGKDQMARCFNCLNPINVRKVWQTRSCPYCSQAY